MCIPHSIIVSERLKPERVRALWKFRFDADFVISIRFSAVYKCFWHQATDYFFFFLFFQGGFFKKIVHNLPDFPSTCYSLMDLVCTHCNCKTFNKFCIVIYCHCLPVSGLGNLRTCCHPWMYSPFLRRILRNQTLIPRIRRNLVSSLH